MSEYNKYHETPIQFLCDEEKNKRKGFPDYVGRECVNFPGFYESLTLKAQMDTSKMIPVIWGKDPRIVVMTHQRPTDPTKYWHATRHDVLRASDITFRHDMQFVSGCSPADACEKFQKSKGWK